ERYARRDSCRRRRRGRRGRRRRVRRGRLRRGICEDGRGEQPGRRAGEQEQEQRSGAFQHSGTSGGEDPWIVADDTAVIARYTGVLEHGDTAGPRGHVLRIATAVLSS